MRRMRFFGIVRGRRRYALRQRGVAKASLYGWR